jgi:sRNA-binding protein
VKVFKFAAGLAVGYVLGSRAGREKYEQIVAAARKAQDHPAVTQAQQKAKELLGSSSSDSTAETTAPETTATVTTPTTESASPMPRPPRRQPRTTVTVPDATTDPLA